MQSDRKRITEWLSCLTEKYIDPHNDPRIYWAKEVTIDYGTGHQTRVDYMKFKPVNNTISGIEKGDFYCFEVKSSIEDFNSPNGHNFIGDLNYYVMPEEVFLQVKNKIPYAIGVLTPQANYAYEYLTVSKPAHRKNREKAIPELLLMMWRSSRREVVNIRKKEKKEKECFYEKESENG